MPEQAPQTEKAKRLENVQFLGSLEDSQEVSVGGMNPQKMTLKEIFQCMENVPEMVAVSLKAIQVEIGGRAMRLVEFLEEDLMEANKIDDQKKVLYNVQLEDDEEILLEGKNPYIKPLQEVLDHVTVVPDSVSVYLRDLQAEVRGCVGCFLDFAEAEQQEVLSILDLRTDLYHFLLVELRNLMNGSSAGRDLLPEGGKKREEMLKDLAQRMAQYLSPRFPISTQQLQELSKGIKCIVLEVFEGFDVTKVVFLANSISSVVDHRKNLTPDSFLAKIHEHPSNRAAIMEKVTAKKK